MCSFISTAIYYYSNLDLSDDLYLLYPQGYTCIKKEGSSLVTYLYNSRYACECCELIRGTLTVCGGETVEQSGLYNKEGKSL